MDSETEGKPRTGSSDKWKFIAEWCQKNHVSPFDDYWYKRAEESYFAWRNGTDVITAGSSDCTLPR